MLHSTITSFLRKSIALMNLRMFMSRVLSVFFVRRLTCKVSLSKVL